MPVATVETIERRESALFRGLPLPAPTLSRGQNGGTIQRIIHTSHRRWSCLRGRHDPVTHGRHAPHPQWPWLVYAEQTTCRHCDRPLTLEAR